MGNNRHRKLVDTSVKSKLHSKIHQQSLADQMIAAAQDSMCDQTPS